MTKAITKETQMESKNKVSTTQTTTLQMHNDMQSQTEFKVELNEQNEYCVNRVDPQQVGTEMASPNEAPPTMSTNQLETSHKIIMASVVESTNKATTAEIEEDTPLYRKNLQQVMGVNFFAAATRKDTNIKPIVNFVHKSLEGASTRIWRLLVQRLETGCMSRKIANYWTKGSSFRSNCDRTSWKVCF